MNKITSKPELNIQYRTLNKAQTDTFRHEMIMKTSQLLNSQITLNKKDSNIMSENSHQKNIFIKKIALQRTVSVYQWRYKTCYPVVKPIKVIVKSFTASHQQKRTLCKKNSQSLYQIWNLDQNIYELFVYTERVNYRLSQLGVLSLPQLFYLLKQILVGFECLIDIFGLFQPTEQMVIVNEENQWRFWISEDFASNSKKQSNISEPQFILKIIKMVQTRLPNSKVGMKFFDDLKNLPIRSLTFLNLLDMTNIFISFNKIMVAKKFVSSNNKSNNSLYGSKNQSYFGVNRTYNQLKDTPKSFNDKTCSNIHTISHFESNYLAKQVAGPSKLNSMKSMNQRSFNKKQINHIFPAKINEGKKQKQLKAHLKISELYCAQTLSKNKIQKRASFLFHSNDGIKQRSQNIRISQFIPEVQKSPISPRNTISYNNEVQYKLDNKYETQKKMRPFSPVERQRKFSFEIPKQKIEAKTIANNEVSQTQTTTKQRKNSYYDYEKPTNKQAFSQSPHKSRKTTFIDQSQKEILRGSIRNQNNLITRENVNRSRKYSEHVPKIKSLDQFAKKNKKMCESGMVEVTQTNKDIKYGNLKSKDIACHTRNATISGMAFGQTPKKIDTAGFNNINNDLYNGKFEQIMKSIKSRSNEGKQDKKNQNDFDDFSPISNNSSRLRRRATAFEMIRDCRQVKEIEQEEPNQKFIKPIVRVSNANNQTAQTLNRSQLQLAKGSQQSNGVSNSNGISNSNVRQSDSSNQKSPYLFVNRKGYIGQSNLSVISCKTHQPCGKEISDKKKRQDKIKQMATSQDCFNKNQSQSSEEFLKSNNWNKKISGLFSDVASIKLLKESNHFGDEFDVFEKDYLKDVKLQKLDKFGKQLKCSIIQTEDGRHILNLPTRNGQNKSFSLIGQVKEQPYENDPSYLEYSTSMICQSKHQEERAPRTIEINQAQRNLKNCQSFEQQMDENEQIRGGFNFSTQLYKIQHNQC